MSSYMFDIILQKQVNSLCITYVSHYILMSFIMRSRDSMVFKDLMALGCVAGEGATMAFKFCRTQLLKCPVLEV